MKHVPVLTLMLAVAFVFSACDYISPWDFKDNVSDSFDDTVQGFVDDHLRPGIFTVCKIATDDAAMGFDFNATVRSPRTSNNQDIGPLTLKDGECQDFWTPGPPGATGAPDTVSVTEVVPSGWDTPHITVFSLEEGSSTPSVHDEMGPTHVGTVLRGKTGCLLVYTNEKKKSWSWHH